MSESVVESLQSTMSNPSHISKRRTSALKDGSPEYLAKRAELIAIAASQFKQKGYRSTKLAEIGHKAGLDRATVYYYFGSKEELFRECLRSGVQSNLKECVRIFEETSNSPAERLRSIIAQLMRAYDENFPNMYVYIQEDMESVASDKSIWASEIMSQTKLFEQIVINLITEAMEIGELRDDIPVILAANAIFGMLNWTHRWYTPGEKHHAQEIADAFSRIFFEGMARPK